MTEEGDRVGRPVDGREATSGTRDAPPRSGKSVEGRSNAPAPAGAASDEAKRSASLPARRTWPGAGRRGGWRQGDAEGREQEEGGAARGSAQLLRRLSQPCPLRRRRARLTKDLALALEEFVCAHVGPRGGRGKGGWEGSDGRVGRTGCDGWQLAPSSPRPPRPSRSTPSKLRPCYAVAVTPVARRKKDFARTTSPPVLHPPRPPTHFPCTSGPHPRRPVQVAALTLTSTSSQSFSPQTPRKKTKNVFVPASPLVAFQPSRRSSWELTLAALLFPPLS